MSMKENNSDDQSEHGANWKQATWKGQKHKSQVKLMTIANQKKSVTRLESISKIISQFGE